MKSEYKALGESFEELNKAMNEFFAVVAKISRLDRLLIWLSSLLDRNLDDNN